MWRCPIWSEHRVSSPKLDVTIEIRTEDLPSVTTTLPCSIPEHKLNMKNLLLLCQETVDDFLGALQAYEVALYRVQSL